jgi:hypothetical protein
MNPTSQNRKYTIQEDQNVFVFLDTYGPTNDEITWTDNIHFSLKSDAASAERRLVVVKQFYPNARVVEITK